MHTLHLNLRKLVRVATIVFVCLIGIWIWGGTGPAAAQEVPSAPSGSIFLPNIASGSHSGPSDLVYNFTFDSNSGAIWASITEVFTQYGTSLRGEGATLEIATDKDGASHKVATIRCIGDGCGAVAATEHAISSSNMNGTNTLELVVHLDDSRSLVFTPLSSNALDLTMMMDDERLSEIRFTCDGCTIEVTIDELFAEPTSTATALPTATREPSVGTATPEPTPSPTDDDVDDIEPPTISDVSVQPAVKSAVVRWKTNEPSSGIVEYGTTPAYELGLVNSDALTTSHFVSIGNLVEDTTYYCRITSADANGNLATVDNTTFTTDIPSEVPEGSFIETFDGEPASPQAWTSDQWDTTVHSRDRETFSQLLRMDAHHGDHCEPPMATHSISAYEDAVFLCRNHMMTAINAGGYGLIYLTPAYQVDFSEGTATIRFDMSTFRSSHRDWIDIYISPMEDHLQLALEDWLPDLSGEPKNAIKVRMQSFNGNTPFTVDVLKDYKSLGVDSTWWVGYEEYLEPSASTRTTFELQISRTHLKFGMPQYDFWWVDTDIAPLDWTEGVVQFGHHSYTPEKECFDPNGCSANTWHWDNVSIEPAQPFTMIHSTKRWINSTDAVANFEAPAPENAFLRFAGLGKNIEVSFNNGATWEAAQVQDQIRYVEQVFWSYFTPIPAGVESVQFRGKDWYGGRWLVRDLSIWAE